MHNIKKGKLELSCTSVPAGGFHSSGKAMQAAGGEKESMVLPRDNLCELQDQPGRPATSCAPAVLLLHG